MVEIFFGNNTSLVRCVHLMPFIDAFFSLTDLWSSERNFVLNLGKPMANLIGQFLLLTQNLGILKPKSDINFG